jgi:hypothetical protein
MEEKIDELDTCERCGKDCMGEFWILEHDKCADEEVCEDCYIACKFEE